jgi:hypothetical protein
MVMSTVMIRRQVNIAITAYEVGEEFAKAPSDVQVQFLLGMAHAAQAFDWPGQCRFIVDEMDNEQRQAVWVELSTLMEHISEQV